MTMLRPPDLATRLWRTVSGHRPEQQATTGADYGQAIGARIIVKRKFFGGAQALARQL